MPMCFRFSKLSPDIFWRIFLASKAPGRLGRAPPHHQRRSAPSARGPGGATLRLLSDLTGRPAWGGPVVVLMFDPVPTYGRRRAPAAARALGLCFVAGIRRVQTRAPLLSACWVPVDGPLPTLGTPTSGKVGPVQTPFEGIKPVAGTG